MERRTLQSFVADEGHPEGQQLWHLKLLVHKLAEGSLAGEWGGDQLPRACQGPDVMLSQARGGPEASRRQAPPPKHCLYTAHSCARKPTVSPSFPLPAGLSTMANSGSQGEGRQSCAAQGWRVVGTRKLAHPAHWSWGAHCCRPYCPPLPGAGRKRSCIDGALTGPAALPGWERQGAAGQCLREARVLSRFYHTL